MCLVVRVWLWCFVVRTEADLVVLKRSMNLIKGQLKCLQREFYLLELQNMRLREANRNLEVTNHNLRSKLAAS